MYHIITPGSRSRQLLVWTALILTLTVLGLLIVRLAKIEALPIDDFVQYWAAGRLMITGGNPYDPDQVFPLQKSVGWTGNESLTTFLPPWTLILFIPFGSMSYPVARMAWMGLNFSLVLLGADWLWHLYGGPSEKRWIAWLIGITFAPALFVLERGQTGPLILLGVIGFLHFEKRQNGWLAGACAILAAIKPHLLYLFWIALLLWAIKRRFWPVLPGAGLAGLAAMMIPLTMNPTVIRQYIHRIAFAPPIHWIDPSSGAVLFWLTPTFGTLLRLFLGAERSWLQFVPLLVGMIWFVFYWRRHRQRWEWSSQMPALLFVSLITTAYGWTFDQVVLLVAVIQVAVILSQGRSGCIGWTIGFYLIINGVVLVLHYVVGLHDLWFLWLAPLFLGWYWMILRHTNAGLEECRSRM